MTGNVIKIRISDEKELYNPFDEVTELAAKHHITLPGQFTMLGRSILATEGVIEQLCPELDLFKLLSDKIMDYAKKNFDLKQSILNIGKDLLATGKKTAKIRVLPPTLFTRLQRAKQR